MIAFQNNVKTAVLLAAMMGLFGFVGLYWGMHGMIIALVLAGAMNFFVWFASARLAIAAMRAQEVDASSAPALYGMVKKLADRAELPMPRVYICPHDAPNAFATGRNPRHAAVAVTQGALRLLNEHELEGVIAHELAHIRNRDTLISTIAATIAGVFSILAQSIFFFGLRGGRGGNPLALIGIIILGAIGAALLKAMISRSREFVADADGAAIAGTPDGLASALSKLDMVARQVPMQQPNPAMNNLFIVEPFMGKTLTALFATHPPIEKRLAALRSR